MIDEDWPLPLSLITFSLFLGELAIFNLDFIDYFIF
jgi:hypothetical protein